MLGPMRAPASSCRSTIIDLPAKEGPMTPNIADIIRQHVSLAVRCIDRVYLHAYMPKLQTSGGLCYFLHDHLGHPIPSPALFRPMHDRFVDGGRAFAATRAFRPCPFEPGQSKDDDRGRRPRAIHRAARASSSSASRRRRCGPSRRTSGGPRPAASASISRGSRSPSITIYFYVHDRDWGPAFLKIGTYLPVSREALSQRP